MSEIQSRNFKIFFYDPKDLSIIDSRVVADGFFIKFQTNYLHDENKLGELCARLEGELEGNWRIIPWFVENAWFFDLLKNEEY